MLQTAQTGCCLDIQHHCLLGVCLTSFEPYAYRLKDQQIQDALETASVSDKGRQSAEQSAKDAKAMQQRLGSELAALQKTVASLEHANRCPITPLTVHLCVMLLHCSRMHGHYAQQKLNTHQQWQGCSLCSAYTLVHGSMFFTGYWFDAMVQSQVTSVHALPRTSMRRQRAALGMP